MGQIKNEPSIINDETVNVNRNQIEHRATWMGLSYIAAKETGLDIEDILRSAVCRTGCLHGGRIKEKLTEPVKLDEFADAFLTPVGIDTFEMEFKTKSEDTLEIRFHYCPLVSGWLKAGISEEDIPLLCDIAMDGDRNIASTAGVDFTLGKTIAAGDDVCEVNFYRKK
ncbi:MAG: L-2-amino-thiazoline-4-carboxylic acid hydrolase [Dehalococcoidales bacterium]|nr:L-2-amino-thiazoline-4-carboxylic acid hydrolase [Dehalococcoidales bacterium]